MYLDSIKDCKYLADQGVASNYFGIIHNWIKFVMPYDYNYWPTEVEKFTKICEVRNQMPKHLIIHFNFFKPWVSYDNSGEYYTKWWQYSKNTPFC